MVLRRVRFFENIRGPVKADVVLCQIWAQRFYCHCFGSQEGARGSTRPCQYVRFRFQISLRRIVDHACMFVQVRVILAGDEDDLVLLVVTEMHPWNFSHDTSMIYPNVLFLLYWWHSWSWSERSSFDIISQSSNHQSLQVLPFHCTSHISWDSPFVRK